VIVLARAGVAAPERLLAPVNESLASLVQALVQWVGITASRHDALLYVPGAFACEIVIGCTGLLPAAVVAVAILTTPGPAAAKRWGLVAGVGVMLLINVVRLTHLFYLGVHAPRQFPVAHLFLWEIGMVAAALAVWLTVSRPSRAVR
jgi:exosortase/archaeosortase family protein